MNKKNDQNTPRAIFIAARQESSVEARAECLAEACGSDLALLQQVEAMLVAADAEDLNPLDEMAKSLEQHDREVSASHIDIESHPCIGPYKLLEKIGEGGMGDVYMAQQTEPMRRRVALKVIKPGMDSRSVVARFEAERQSLAMMEHPNIAKVFDGGTTDRGLPYFVMELVSGMPITEFCDDQKLDTKKRLAMFREVCLAVQHAHLKGVIHRDIKPSNILVTMHDGVPVPKIIDFGIAKSLDQELTSKTLFTRFGQILGTPQYMSPEQLEMSGLGIDTRSDVYSLGVAMYELLAGSPPFDTDAWREAGFDEVRRIIREDEPPQPSEKLSSLEAAHQSTTSTCRSTDPRKLSHLLRGELDWIVMRAMEKDRDRRYESASALAGDIERYLNNETVEACPPSVSYQMKKFVRRNKLRLGLGIVMLVVLAVILKFEIESQRHDQITARSVTERLTSARVFLQAHDYQAAREQLDLAQGRLDQVQWYESALVTAVSTLSKEVSGKFRAEKFFNDFQQLRQRVYSEIYQIAGTTRLQTQADCDAALRIYRVLESGLWTERPEFQDLDSKRQSVLKEGVVELLYILARGEAENPLLPEHSGYGDPLVVAAGHQRAIEALRRIGTFHQPVPAAYLWMSRSWRALGEEDLAGKAEEHAKLPASTTFMNYFLRGDFHAVQGSIGGRIDRIHLEQALQNYSQALRLKPDHFLSLLASGNTLYGLQRYEVAEAMLTGAIAVFPRTPFALIQRGVCRRKQNKLDQAQADFFKVMEIDPHHFKAFEQQSHVFVQKGNLTEALAMVDKAVEANPYSFNSRLNRGKLHARIGDDEQAIADFTYLIEYLERHFETTKMESARDYLVSGFFERALALARLDQIEDARRDVTNAMNVDPDSAACQILVAEFLLTGRDARLRDLAQAVEWAKKAVQQAPQQELYWRTLGKAYRQLGDNEKARSHYDQLVKEMEQKRPNQDFTRLRAEMAELLGISIDNHTQPE